jgi:hypothetical protein
VRDFNRVVRAAEASDHARCTKLYVLNVHKSVKFHSSQKKADLYFAETAILRRKTVNLAH